MKTISVLLILFMASLPFVMAQDVDVEKYFTTNQKEDIPYTNQDVIVSSADPYNLECSILVKDAATNQQFPLTLRKGEEHEISGLNIKVEDVDTSYRCKLRVRTDSSGPSSVGGSGSGSSGSGAVAQTPVAISSQPGSLVHDVPQVTQPSFVSGKVVPIGPGPQVPVDFAFDTSYMQPAVLFITEDYLTQANAWTFPAFFMKEGKVKEPYGFSMNVMVAVSSNPAFMKLQSFTGYTFDQLLKQPEFWTLLSTDVLKSHGYGTQGVLHPSGYLFWPPYIYGSNGQWKENSAFIFPKPGTYYAFVWLDYDNKIQETDESNNMLALQIEIPPNPQARPDIKERIVSKEPQGGVDIVDLWAEKTNDRGYEGYFKIWAKIVDIENGLNTGSPSTPEERTAVTFDVLWDDDDRGESELQQIQHFQGLYDPERAYYYQYLDPRYGDEAVVEVTAVKNGMKDVMSAEFEFDELGGPRPEIKIAPAPIYTPLYPRVPKISCEEKDYEKCRIALKECYEKMTAEEAFKCVDLQKRCDTVCQPGSIQKIPPEAVFPERIRTASGCNVDGDFNTVVPVFTRIALRGVPVYCDLDNVLKPQKEPGMSAMNNAECKSNFASNGKCINIEEQIGILRRLVRFLSWMFGGGEDVVDQPVIENFQAEPLEAVKEQMQSAPSALPAQRMAAAQQEEVSLPAVASATALSSSLSELQHEDDDDFDDEDDDEEDDD